MNFQNILKDIERVDPEVYERLDTRRESLRSFSGIGKKIALTALPLALGGMFKKAYGQTSTVPDIIAVLNFALTLEYLEAKFYSMAIGTSGLIAASEIASFSTIAGHEAAHVTVLTNTIKSLNGVPATEPTFDFTAGGTFPDVFATKDFGTFLALSQTFEDTGVRAYKGQANNANLMANNAVLTAALDIHSVEARHAAHVRQLRRKMGDSTTKPWITGSSIGTLPTGVQASYNGEDLTTQANVNITSLKDSTNNITISTSAASEAFDEPLTMDAVLTIVTPFIKK